MGSDSQQQFCLRWNNFQNSLLSTLPQLLDGEDLTDVTLCAGGRSIKAHRIVLSACSQYFMDIFRELQPVHHPVIVVPGADFNDLCALVTFMYNGEVNIYQHQLAGLLSMADLLHIRGLAEFTTESCRPEPPTIVEQSRVKRPKLTTPGGTGDILGTPMQESLVNPYRNMYVRKPRSALRAHRGNGETSSGSSSASVWRPSGDSEEAEDLSKRHDSSSGATTPVTPTMEGIKQEPITTDLSEVSPPPDLSQGSGDSTASNVRQISIAQSKLYATCRVCGKQLSNQYNLRVHMETHQNQSYACSSCSHVSRSRDALRKHVSYRHPTPTQHSSHNSTT